MTDTTARLRAALEAAGAYAAHSHGNLTGDKYRAREEARDVLLDALAGYDAALSEEAAVPLDVERLRQVLRTWEREGHGMLCPSADYIAREYAIRTEREHILADVEDDR